MTFFKLPQKIFITLALLGILSTTITSLAQSTSNVPQGGIGIVPTRFDPKTPITKGWFLETIKPGESVRRSATIINTNPTDVEVEIRSKDSRQTQDGTFTYADNSEKDTMVGSWVTLEKNKIRVPAKKSLAIEFTIKVPTNTKPGEYAGVIAVQPAQAANQRGIQMVTRVGARMYITVPGQLQTGATIKNLNFLTPALEQYQPLAQKNPNISKDSMFLVGTLESTSNIYTKLKGQILITGPNGNFKKDIDQDFGPKRPVELFIAIPDGKWVEGKYTAKFSYQSQAMIPVNKQNLTNSSPAEISTDLVMTKESLAQMEVKAQTQSSQNTPTAEGTGFEIKENSSISSSACTDQNGCQSPTPANQDGFIIRVLVGVVAGLLAIISILIIYFLKKRASNPKV